MPELVKDSFNEVELANIDFSVETNSPVDMIEDFQDLPSAALTHLEFKF